MTNPTHDVEIQGHVVFCRHCTCSACAPAREMASASEKQAGEPPTEPVRLTCRRPYETHNVSGHRVDLFRGEDGGIVVEVPAIPGCITQGKDHEEALANAAEAIAVSIEPDSPIAQLIATALPATIQLALVDLGLPVLIVIPRSIIAAGWRGRPIDWLITAVNGPVLAVPHFCGWIPLIIAF